MSITGKELFRTHDEYGAIQVIDDGNKRYLAFSEGDEQSCMLKSEPAQLQHDYTQAMLLVLLFNQPQQTTLFGLGGGCLASCLHHHLPDIQLEVIELRAAVIQIAQRYFQLPKSERLSIINADVRDWFSREDNSKSEILFSDIYLGDGVDSQQLQPSFVDQCYAQLTDNGWLVLNCWKEHRSETFMLDTIKAYFTDVRICTTQSGNWIIFAGKKQNLDSKKQLMAKSRTWSQKLGFSLQPSLNRLVKCEQYSG